ncbi:unnamed protein product [Schistocephalus solidus]|uniref:Peptidase A2 domain-containing protein n=1 Tax=Schistocephalus solidus TaxID=70667 RepID=A0A183TTT8_SCHSO|nr:unnamed protein product [Schistocephalus solidus]
MRPSTLAIVPVTIFYACDRKRGRSFLVDNGAQISAIPSTAAVRRCANNGLFLQSVNFSPIATSGPRSLSLDIGLRQLFPWIFVVADVPPTNLSADFRTTSDLLLDCKQHRLHNHATNISAKGFNPNPGYPFLKLLAKYPSLTELHFYDSSLPRAKTFRIQRVTREGVGSIDGWHGHSAGRALLSPISCSFTSPTLYPTVPYIPSSPMVTTSSYHLIKRKHSSHKVYLIFWYALCMYNSHWSTRSFS